jgi:hypothetical protein
MIEEVKLPFPYENLHALALLDWDGSESSEVFQRLMADISTRLARANETFEPQQEYGSQQTTTQVEKQIHETPLTFTVAALAHVETSETQNAVQLANLTQQSFKFVFHPRTVSIQEEKYRLSNGALDLVGAVHALTKTQRFKRLVFDELILVTSKADADKESETDVAIAFENQCYFMRETLPFAKNVAVVSTYTWDRLLRTEVIPTNASGRRALQPYLLLSFAIIALARSMSAPLGYHFDTKGCPLDRCDEVREIDRVFAGGRFCDRCESILENMKSEGKLSNGRLASVRALLSAAGIGRVS